MSRNIILLIIAGFIICCQSNSTKDKTQAHAKPDSNRLGVVVMEVKGMTCTGCENTITRNVSLLDGINSCTVSHIEGIAQIEYDTSLTTILKITDAIEKSGYHVEEVHAIRDTTKIIN